MVNTNKLVISGTVLLDRAGLEVRRTWVDDFNDLVSFHVKAWTPEEAEMVISFRYTDCTVYIETAEDGSAIPLWTLEKHMETLRELGRALCEEVKRREGKPGPG